MVGRLELQDDFKEQAEWRREKAKQYPDDKRHLEAAAIFDRLAATVDAIPQDVFIAFSKLEVDDGLLDVERWTAMLRDVGFGLSPKTAEEFVRRWPTRPRARTKCTRFMSTTQGAGQAIARNAVIRMGETSKISGRESSHSPQEPVRQSSGQCFGRRVLPSYQRVPSAPPLNRCQRGSPNVR